MTTQTFTTDGTWTCPDWVTSVRVECWGGGAGGGPVIPNSNYGGGGGGSGGYAYKNVLVYQGYTYNFTVAQATTLNGEDGHNTIFYSDTTVAVAGYGGLHGSGSSGGVGGSYFPAGYSGGTGGAGQTRSAPGAIQGGGGAGGATSSATGANGKAGLFYTGGQGGAPNGGDCMSWNFPVDGSFLARTGGGGGAGGGYDSGGVYGANGASGSLQLTWTVSTNVIVANSILE